MRNQFSHNVELFAVPLIGTELNYKMLSDHLDFSSAYLDWSILNSYVVDAIGTDPDSSTIGNGMWSDMAHIIGHRVLDECIPYTEYKDASLPFDSVKRLIKMSDEKHAKIVEDGKKAFVGFSHELDYSHRNKYIKIVNALLMYKYSPFAFWTSSFKYAKVVDEMSSLTVNRILREHNNVSAVLDPHAINKTVSKLKTKGYRVIKTEYIPFIKL